MKLVAIPTFATPDDEEPTGTATLNGAGYTVEWDDGAEDFFTTRWGFELGDGVSRFAVLELI